MTKGLLMFGNLSLPWVTAEDEGISIYSTPFVLYDGRTVLSGISEVGKTPSFRGVAKAEGFVTSVLAEIGTRRNLTVNEKYLGYGGVTSFGYSYMSTNSIDNYYRYSIGFTLENLS